MAVRMHRYHDYRAADRHLCTTDFIGSRKPYEVILKLLKLMKG